MADDTGRKMFVRWLCGCEDGVHVHCFWRWGGDLPLVVRFFVFLPRNEHFCAYVPRERHCATAHKPVCVRVICKGEG